MKIAGIDLHALNRGFVFGCIAFLVSAVLAFASKRERPGLVGAPLTIAALLAIRSVLGANSVPFRLAGVLAVAAVGALLTERIRHEIWFAMIVLAPAGVLLAVTPLPGITVETRIVAAMGVPVLAALTADFDRRHARDGFALAFVPITAGVLVFSAPRSLPNAALLGATLPFVLLAVPRARVRIGAMGSACFAIGFWWTAILVAGNHPGRLATAFGAGGLLLCEPIARKMPRVARKNDKPQRPDPKVLVAIVAVLAQVTAGVYLVEVTNRQDAGDIAALSLVPLAAVGVLTARRVVPSARPRRRHAPAERPRSGRRGG